MTDGLNLSSLCDLLRVENAEIVIADEQEARVGRYGEFFYSYCFVDDELHSLNTYYQQQHLYYWDGETRPGTLTGSFRQEGYSAQELIFLKRYAPTPGGYQVAESLFLTRGGDPRLVSNGRDAYATHIVSDGTHWLHNLRERTQVEITLPLPREQWGKNWQPFLAGDELYILHEMEPLRVIRLSTDSGRGEIVREIEMGFNMPCLRPIEPRPYPMFRGGSNALAVADGVIGAGRATSIGYRHSPFFWSLSDSGHFEVRFSDLFSEFFKRGIRLIDPTCLFLHQGDVYLGFCGTERDWSHNQLVRHFLLTFPADRSVRGERSLLRYFEERPRTDANGPNLDAHLFVCPEMPAEVEHVYEHAGRRSTGVPGCLVHGPNVTIEAEGRYRAELSYTTLGCPGARAGKLDVTLSRGEESRTIAAADITESHREMGETRVEFDTTGFLGWRLETRVRVERGALLNAFHIRTWRADEHEGWADAFRS